jgi:18S rRNA (adenine1779-N6/adenine1780-N6)-dimethyltransferase
MMLEENMRTHFSLNNLPLPEPFPCIKSFVEEILTETGYLDSRAARMDLNDFLCLLSAFNSKGIHFS